VVPQPIRDVRHQLAARPSGCAGVISLKRRRLQHREHQSKQGLVGLESIGVSVAGAPDCKGAVMDARRDYDWGLRVAD
jgi:hypothetical protein